MITKVHLKNFRGIEEAEINVGKVTILTGANNSGKSSVMYALLSLRNIVSNPNQPLDSFFNFLFMNLGGFKESVYLKDEDSRRMTLEVGCAYGDAVSATYGITLGKSQSTMKVQTGKPIDIALKLDVTFPYALNLSAASELELGGAPLKITWNGITPTLGYEKKEGFDEEEAKRIGAALLAPVLDVRGVDFVALKRGFVKPIFSPVPLQAQLITEDEIATFIANDRDLEARVNFYLERIVNKNFQARPTLGTANFYLQTTDRNTGFLCDLVNDGFGTNQLVFLLAKALRKDQTTICIEEPEIHLHPGAIIRLVETLVEIAKEHNRNFIISTHSEHFVLALLNKLARQTIAPSDVRIYFLRKEKARTILEEQHVTEKGQIEGGLKAFYDTELGQLREFLGIQENP